MLARFVKMHGLGNDFVVFDERTGPLGLTAARAAAIADRHTGIGCDQLISIEPAPAGSGADAAMRIRNADGSEAGACGNATRCVAELLLRDSGAHAGTIRTAAGNLSVERLPDGLIRVDMGEPRLHWRDIPLARAMDTLHVDLYAGEFGPPAACSMGNPHATFFVADLDRVPVAALGPELERASLFPDRANIGFAQVLAPDRLRLRVWERGAGLTRACGSGACAALVNAHRRGLAGRRAAVLLDGGELGLEWRDNDHVLMTGPVATAFRGTIELADYPT
ncbi:MAG: diaminopimelate epimerase [Alphaproteobacteria bacterium]|nr:diaminopimelate epimerase [Alphaproteobacteria bacterium]